MLSVNWHNIPHFMEPSETNEWIPVNSWLNLFFEFFFYLNVLTHYLNVLRIPIVAKKCEIFGEKKFPISLEALFLMFFFQNVTVFQSNCSHNHRLKKNGNTHSLNQNGNFPSLHNNYTAGNGQNCDSNFELSDNCTVTSDIAVKKCSAWRSSTRNRSFRKIWLFNT